MRVYRADQPGIFQGPSPIRLWIVDLRYDLKDHAVSERIVVRCGGLGRAVARGGSWRQRLGFGLEDVDLVLAVVAVHVVAADKHHSSVGEFRLARAVDVVAKPLGEAGILERGLVEVRPRLGHFGDVVLSLTGECERVGQIPHLNVFDAAVEVNPSRDAAAMADDAEAPVHAPGVGLSDRSLEIASRIPERPFVAAREGIPWRISDAER